MALEQAMPDEEEDDMFGDMVRGLDGAEPGPDFDAAIELFDMQRLMGKQPDFADEFRNRVTGARERLQSRFSDLESAAGRMREGYAGAKPDANLPWLHFAAGMLKPTRTGAFGESLGSGIEGLAGGMDRYQTQRISTGQKAADADLEAAKVGYKGAEDIENFDLRAFQTEAKLRQSQAMLNRDPELVRMYNWANDRNVPPEERTRRARAFEMRYGTALQKNATGVSDPNAVNSPEMARQINAPLWLRAVSQAEKQFPEAAFEGRPIAERNAAINAKALEIFKGIPGIGTQQAPQGAQIPPRPAQAAQVPSAPLVEEPQSVEAPPKPSPFDAYLKPTTQQSLPNATIPNAAQRAGQVEASKAAETRASTYLEKEVYPGISMADEARASASIAQTLLDKDPTLTGAMKPFFGQVVNFMTTLGLSPKIAQEFANDQSIFYSQAMIGVLAKQLSQKGVQTESDAQRMLQAGIDPSKLPETNQFLIRYMNASADRMYERGAFFDAWSEKNQGRMGGSVEAWNKYSAANPIAKMVDGKILFRKVK